jgi:hypothetical protein
MVLTDSLTYTGCPTCKSCGEPEEGDPDPVHLRVAVQQLEALRRHQRVPGQGFSTAGCIHKHHLSYVCMYVVLALQKYADCETNDNSLETVPVIASKCW